MNTQHVSELRCRTQYICLLFSQSKDTLQTDNVLVATGQQVSLVIIMETWVLVQS